MIARRRRTTEWRRGGGEEEERKREEEEKKRRRGFGKGMKNRMGFEIRYKKECLYYYRDN